MKETLIIDREEFSDNTEQQCDDDSNGENSKNYYKIIFDVEAILKNKEQMAKLMEIGADIEESEEEYVKN